ncbi:uncharacterized protein BYT42DRAFT_98894 [Radiomyces spectabilis]|uniref:uncharacterized protein n=1 Tax=Radiomyces spectabilis TaxID=64574 RepID=UPI00221FA70D|nr:uncharacterized protein BYT42DRAFT_98894 [Radiomyces spectabilis]KAI8370685.1 hypothetical protein BYT42DRAFT_98894 [Radiomyces spectabilis]
MTVTESTCHAEDDHPGTVRNNHSPAAVITASPVLWRHSSQRPSHQPSVQPDMSQAVQCINLMALGKTGNGKSSLLNDIAGYEVFKQKASVKVRIFLRHLALSMLSSMMKMQTTHCVVSNQRNPRTSVFLGSIASLHA